MKKLVLLLVAVMAVGFCRAQISFTADTVSTSVDIDKDDVVGYGFVNNLAPQVKNYGWKATEMELSQGWAWAICDKNTCYAPGVDSMTFTLGPAESGRMDVHLYPDGVAGSNAAIKMTVSDLQNPSNKAEAFYFFSTLLVNNKEVELASLRVFPNPTQGSIRIDGLDGKWEARYSLYTLDGKLLQENSFREMTFVNTDGLSTGLYLLKVQLDEQGSSFQQLIQKID
ncbi:MAG: T9SS type A sorting domain-containing protein [Bacteroidota bacterium]